MGLHWCSSAGRWEGRGRSSVRSRRLLRSSLIVLVVLLAAAASSYTVHARFVSASQIVKGNAVKVSGAAGRLGRRDRAHRRRPGRRHADDRRRRLLPAAPRHARDHPPDVAVGRRQPLRRPAARRRARRGHPRRRGRSPTDSTEAAVDLDQIFNTFDPKTPRRDAEDRSSSCATSRPAARTRPTPRCATSTRRCRRRAACSPSSTATRPDFERFIVETSQARHRRLRPRRRARRASSRNLATTTSALTSARRQPRAGHRPAAQRHAQGEHDVRQPARLARRPHAARRRRQADRARRSCARCSPSCARSRATRGRRSATCRARSAARAPTTTSSSCCAASPRSTRSPTQTAQRNGKDRARRASRRRSRRSTASRRSSPSCGPTRPTSSAGSTTSPRAAPTTRWAASRARPGAQRLHARPAAEPAAGPARAAQPRC